MTSMMQLSFHAAASQLQASLRAAFNRSRTGFVVRPPRRMAVFIVILLSCFLARAQEDHRAGLEGTGKSTSVVSMSELPLAFEPNVGQGPPQENYLARSGAMQIGFSPGSLSLRLPSEGGPRGLEITLVNANRDVEIEASEKSQGESNYLLGNQPSAWKTHIPQYGRLTYRNIYRGVDLVFYGTGGRVEHDFAVRPGADYRQIRMRYQGAEKLMLSANGDLHLSMGTTGTGGGTRGTGELIVRTPHIYQNVLGRRIERSGSFVLLGGDEVAFKVDAYDPALPLVIDPVLDYVTYLANLSLYVYGAAVDASGNTYVLGQTYSSSYPVTAGAYQTTCSACVASNQAAFITKLNATGTAQIYSTFLGGSGSNQPAKIVVDGNGDAIVTGYTGSTDFPLQNPISAGTPSFEDGFVTSLAPDGASLNFSSRLGGASSAGTSATTLPGGVAVDASGNVYVSGITESPYLPVTAGALNAGSPSYFNGDFVFLTKLQPKGNLVYSAILGAIGEASDCCGIAGVAVDSSGNAYLAGTAGVTDFTSVTPWPITTGAYQSAMISPGQTAPFVTKVSADGSTILYSTLVTTGETSAMALTSNNQVILVGSPNYNFPVTSNAYSSTTGTSFIAELSADGTQLPYSSYFSTSQGDTGGNITNVALDASGDVWLGGHVQYVANIPMVDPLQSMPGTSSAFVTEFDLNIQKVLFSTYFYGTQTGSSLNGLAIDNLGRAHIVGTGQYDLPTSPSVYLSSVSPPASGYSGEYGFAALIDPNAPGPAICFSNETEGYTQLGSSGQNASFVITNCGNGPLIISNIQLSSAIFALTPAGECVNTLAAGASCTVEASFTPTAAGNFSAAVTITSNAPVPVSTVSIAAEATAPSIALLQSSIVFPPQVLGISASGSNAPVFVENRGTAPLIVYPAQSTITGPFNIVSNSCGSLVLQGSVCTFTLSYSPTALGSSTGTLNIASDDPVHPSITVSLSGTAIASFTTPVINSLNAPSVALGSTGVKLNIEGANFFPESEVLIGGELQTVTGQGSSLLQVSVDPTLLTVMGEIPVVVVNPSPGGQSNAYPLVVFQALPISAASLVYNSTTGMLYASIPSSATANANTILPINPLTGATGTPIPVGNNPGKLALSSDGAYLYVGLNGDHTLQRINLSTSQIERTFPLPNDSSLNVATTVQDMHGVPGSPQSVVASLSRPASPSEAGAALFTDTGLASFLGNTYQDDNYGVDSFAFTSNPSIFYGYPFNSSFFGETGVSANALSIITQPGFSCCSETTGSLVASDGTLLYTNSGEVWNPTTPTLLGTYTPGSSTLFYESSVVPDTANGRTFFLDSYQGYNGTSGYTDILSYNQSSYAQVGSVSVGVQEYDFVSDLNRWGSDGFAFRSYYQTSSDEIVILRSSIARTATGGTPSLSSLAPANASAGSAATQITVNGSGFIPGTIVQWNGVALETTYVSATQLTALVPGSDFASEGTAQIAAVNPAPGGSSSALTFTILGPLVALSSNNATFGVIQDGTISPVTQISVENTGNAPLTGLVLAITGKNAAAFSQTNSCGSGLAAGASCAVSLTMAPSAPGPLQASLTLTDNAPASPQTVGLTGTGESLSVMVSPSSTSVTSSQSLTVTVSVSGGSGNPTPTGSVTLSSGSYASAATVLNNGSVQIVIPAGSLPAGADTVTATYVPDAASASIYTGDSGTATVTETIENFTIGVSSGGTTTATASPGGQAVYTFTVSPPSGGTFASPITFTVTGLPAGATATFSPATVPAGAGTTAVTMTVNLPSTAEAQPLRKPFGGGALPAALGLLLLPFAGRLRSCARKFKGMLCLIVLCLGFSALVAGCGGSGGGGQTTSAPQNYTLTVTGTSASLSNSFTLTLTVE